MRNSFQQWVEEQHISDESRRIFRESITCQLAEAYSASLLFLYLGFTHVIRERIITSGAPSGIPLGKWTVIQNAVKAEDQWDKAVFDNIKMKDPAPIFYLNDDTRNQVEYWKNRRNDCAHSKGNIISLGHVEALQAFLMSNLNKFVVIGSKDSLLNKIELHFNPTYTPWGKNFDHLIKEIDTSTYKTDLRDFISQVWNKLEITPDPWENSHKHEISFQFIARCFDVGSSEVKKACKDFILTRTNGKFHFFKEHPATISYFRDQPALIREIWKSKLFNSSRNGFGLFASLLKNDLIPKDQLQEALETVLTECNGFLPNEEDDHVLITNGFYNLLEQQFLKDSFSNFDKYNRLRKLVIRYLSNHPIRKEVAEAIYRGFNSESCPFRLRDALEAFFNKNITKREEFQSLIDGDTVDVPTQIDSLAESS